MSEAKRRVSPSWSLALASERSDSRASNFCVVLSCRAEDSETWTNWLASRRSVSRRCTSPPVKGATSICVLPPLRPKLHWRRSSVPSALLLDGEPFDGDASPRLPLLAASTPPWLRPLFRFSARMTPKVSPVSVATRGEQRAEITLEGQTLPSSSQSAALKLSLQSIGSFSSKKTMSCKSSSKLNNIGLPAALTAPTTRSPRSSRSPRTSAEPPERPAARQTRLPCSFKNTKTR
mmetsp:Transcript_137375/g.356974  ORF Transcript_137375/g.356974 Transcript_137375/m.356974 type:complete len:234 (+) Transcript_137375:1005-1706(+)